MFGARAAASQVAQHFVHENRIRQAASSLGAAQFCIDRGVAYAHARIIFGKTLATNQAIQFPLVELHTEARCCGLVRSPRGCWTSTHTWRSTHLVAMCNYRANRLAATPPTGRCRCRRRRLLAAQPFEHIYRHHRRYRITEGSEEIQMRNIARGLFGFGRAGR